MTRDEIIAELLFETLREDERSLYDLKAELETLDRRHSQKRDPLVEKINQLKERVAILKEDYDD
jgi:hypothetical protein